MLALSQNTVRGEELHSPLGHLLALSWHEPGRCPFTSVQHDLRWWLTCSGLELFLARLCNPYARLDSSNSPLSVIAWSSVFAGNKVIAETDLPGES